MKVQIQPISVFPGTASQLELVGVNIRRFADEGQAILTWQLKDSNGSPLKTGIVEIKGADYQGWNSDDPYLVDLVLTKLGLTKA